MASAKTTTPRRVAAAAKRLVPVPENGPVEFDEAAEERQGNEQLRHMLRRLYKEHYGVLPKRSALKKTGTPLAKLKGPFFEGVIVHSSMDSWVCRQEA
jgi:hypothetical protein